jgi:hypothetical protein
MFARFLKSRRLRIVIVLLAIVTGAWALTRPDPDAAPVVAGTKNTITVLDFSNLTSFDNLPEGWRHDTFWFTPPMELSLVEQQGKPALRCETNAGGSILARNADIDLTEFPLIEWSWFIEDPIESDIDERSKEGDDHPARLFMGFLDETGQKHHAEIIWSNRLFAPGEYKYIGEFAHYVANGLDENTGRWQSQSVDLLDIYRKVTGLQDKPRLKTIAIFCDSDNTGGHSVAYFTDVMMRKDNGDGS